MNYTDFLKTTRHKMKQLFIIAACILLLALAACIPASAQTKDTVIVISIADYKKLAAIVTTLKTCPNDAVKLRIDYDLADIGRRARVVVDTVKRKEVKK